MSADDVRDLLPAYASDELDAEARARVERALAGSPQLRAELLAYRRLFVLLAALADEEVTPGPAVERRIMRQITVQWYLGTAARLVEDLAGAYGRAFLYYLGLR